MNIVTQKIMCASTSHMTEKDSILLSKKMINCIEYDSGFFVNTIMISPSFLKLRGFSKYFIELVKISHYKECKFLQLDRDGDEIDGLKTFEW